MLGNGLTALGVVRAFGRCSIPVYVLPHEVDFVMRSRWARPFGQDATIPKKADELEEQLKLSKFERAVLIPCSDNSARLVAAVRERVQSRFLASLPSGDTLDLFVDKGRLAELLSSLDCPHPVTKLIDSVADLASLSEHQVADYFLKPRESQNFFAHFRCKALRATSKSELIRNFTEAEAQGMKMVLQEYVPGGTENNYFLDGFVDRHGETKLLFGRQKLRMYPAGFGNSCYQRAIRLEQFDPVIDSVKKVLRFTKYQGIFSIEFKFDPRDKQLKLLELNARPWWYIDFAARCGVDVSLASYYDALGEKVESNTKYQTGKTNIYPYYDYYAVRELVRSGGMTWTRWLTELATSSQPVLSFDDPLPAIHGMGGIVGGILRRKFFR